MRYKVIEIKAFGVKETLKRNGIGVNEFARALGKNKAFVSKVLNGQIIVSENMAKVFIATLDKVLISDHNS